MGKLFIVSAPSGAGKTTLCQIVLSRLKKIVRSISYTTRPCRMGEVNGQDYHFISEEIFQKMIQDNRFSEWAVVHGYYYGTDLQFINEKINQGIDIILNIDVQGGQQLKEKYFDAVMIFIHTPSFEELKKRLQKRQSDSQHTIEKRLQGAEEELKASSSYPFHIVNDDVEKAALKFIGIIEAERHSKQ